MLVLKIDTISITHRICVMLVLRMLKTNKQHSQTEFSHSTSQGWIQGSAYDNGQSSDIFRPIKAFDWSNQIWSVKYSIHYQWESH